MIKILEKLEFWKNWKIGEFVVDFWKKIEIGILPFKNWKLDFFGKILKIEILEFRKVGKIENW